MGKIGVVINTSEAENFYNALRFSLVALEEGHEVKIFAMGKGVEVLTLSEEKILTLMREVIEKNGKIVA
ncbi:hypothetical protein THC_0216 [Caldimicrobium thiodismutans]|uniref:Uncharacterized protein n=1 Tax=Caldimicrobium thiodismutans TaxID=1653476 RepID=A0A0U5ATM8_9BACT|nr:DsrE family protein [Caldimicrobium thiodismutans]BAU22616.1 hypothetical protein THC_0216 [Caldimicrobium thiodismutans]